MLDIDSADLIKIPSKLTKDHLKRFDVWENLLIDLAPLKSKMKFLEEAIYQEKRQKAELFFSTYGSDAYPYLPSSISDLHVLICVPFC